MDYEDFKEQFVQGVKDRLADEGMDVKISVNEVKKQNMTDLAIAKYDIEHFLNMDRDAAIKAERNKKNREKSL